MIMKGYPVLGRSEKGHDGVLPVLSWLEEAVCYVTLGMICGCVQVTMMTC